MYRGHSTFPSPGFETLHIATSPVPPSPGFLSLGENKERSSSSKNQKLNQLLGVQGLTKQNIFHKVNHTPLCLVRCCFIFIYFLIHCIVTAVCSLISYRLPTFLLSLPFRQNNVPISLMEERLWRLSVSIKTKKQTRITGNHPLSVTSEPEWSFSIIFFFFFSSLLWWSSMYADTGPGGWSKYGEARTHLYRYRQKRKQFCLLASFSRQCMRVWPWNWRLYELLESFSIKQRL